LRDYRDNWLHKHPNGEEIIEKYYEVAPKICSELSLFDNNSEIYDAIYERYILPCIKFIENQKYERTKKLYTEMVDILAEKYLTVE
jgi:hypothetical protein